MKMTLLMSLLFSFNALAITPEKKAVERLEKALPAGIYSGINSSNETCQLIVREQKRGQGQMHSYFASISEPTYSCNCGFQINFYIAHGDTYSSLRSVSEKKQILKVKARSGDFLGYDEEITIETLGAEHRKVTVEKKRRLILGGKGRQSCIINLSGREDEERQDF